MMLVAGIGNIFFGDDGFGCEVARRLAARALPASVRVVDFGIRSIDLAYALLDHDAAILVDVVARGNPPGTLYVLEPEVREGGELDPHGTTPDRILGWLGGARLPRVLRLVGCEPQTFEADALGAEGLSPPVRAAIPEAIALVEGLIEGLSGERGRA
jgi:hydrogenase maturation protease